MKGFMPTGIPFYLERQANGLFSHTLATDRKDFSRESLHCFNYMLYEFANFQAPDRTFYPMKTIINGEKIITHGDKKYRVDCFIQTPEKDYFIEFHGCR